MATTPQQNRTTGKFGEKTVVDKNTFEIKGIDTGTIYGKGRTLQEALALQTQGASGGTPTVSGRPDLYAVSPTAQESIKTIAGAAGQQVTPRVATLSELSQAKSGTLESFNKATGTTTTEAAPITSFADAVRETVNQSVETQKETVLNADENFDTQLLLQRGAIASAMLGETVTPEDLRWLNPTQQAAIRSGDKTLLEAQYIGVNTIINARKDVLEAERKAIEDEEAAALDKLKTLKSLGMLGAIDSESITTVANSLGLEEDALRTMIEDSDALQWELGKDANGNSIMYKFDPITGEYTSQVIQYKTKSSGGGGDSGVEVMSYEEFKELYGSMAKQSIEDPEMQALYDEYVAETFSNISDDYYFEQLTTGDRRNMLARNLNPSSVDNVKTYFAEEYSGDEASKEFKDWLGITE